jgi:thiamine-phosphate pyrophosphorylase
MLDSGCKWIQLRIKDISTEELLPYAEKAKIHCEEHHANLSINDYAEVARDVEAWGLHLGLKDITVDKARTITGGNVKIGGTVNTIEDVRRRIKEGVDYLGLGPLHYTNTKQNLSPVLGFKGVSELMEFINMNEYKIPVIIVGGVTIPDIKELIKIGVHGVGIAAVLTKSDFPKEIVLKIKENINEAIKNS